MSCGNSALRFVFKGPSTSFTRVVYLLSQSAFMTTCSFNFSRYRQEGRLLILQSTHRGGLAASELAAGRGQFLLISRSLVSLHAAVMVSSSRVHRRKTRPEYSDRRQVLDHVILFHCCWWAYHRHSRRRHLCRASTGADSVGITVAPSLMPRHRIRIIVKARRVISLASGADRVGGKVGAFTVSLNERLQLNTHQGAFRTDGNSRH